MFTYLDPSIRRRLIKEEKLIRIGYEGEQLDSEAPQAPGEVIINLLGPIPMPIDTLEGRIIVQWYAAVRSTELQQVEALANKLTSIRKFAGYVELEKPIQDQATFCVLA